MPLRNKPENLRTIGDYVRWAASQFSAAGLYYGHGSDNALDEAYHLITAGLHLPHELPAYMMRTRLTDVEMDRLFHFIQLRVSRRIPVPYLINEAWFAGLAFFVDERVLIPRSPIAELIQSHFNPWIEYESVHQILDLCTGSGCIAIACATYFQNTQCSASDISNSVLGVAEKNVVNHKLEDRINLIQSDLFSNISVNAQFDVIVSNPPYVDAQCLNELPREYHHEPRSALEAGDDGLVFVNRILAEAKHYLSPHGILIVEVGNSKRALIEQHPELPFCWLEFEHGGDGVFLLTRQQLP